MTIRLMDITDFDEVRNLWLNTAGMGLNDIDDSKEGINKFLTRNPTTCFVAEDNGVICGVILGGHDGRRALIYHMAVCEAMRGKGIGSKLLEHATCALRAEGITKAYAVVYADNETGNRFWEKHGFIYREDLVFRSAGINKLPQL